MTGKTLSIKVAVLQKRNNVSKDCSITEITLSVKVAVLQRETLSVKFAVY